jgi:serine/threonine protein kinase
MGVVFEARDPLIGRTVAVKTIRLDILGSPSEADWLQERLFREARAAGALSHPGIVVVHDLGRHEDLAYIAMERVDGPTLERVLATAGRLSATETLNILRQTAAALDYAHNNDVVHRDIKPGNLMLHKGVTLKITDFGIAKIASTQQLTRTGTVIGTPSYMSPEQITAQPVDGRADQFSLAVIAFELLAGRRPFQADTLAGLVHQIVYDERPSARSWLPDLPEAADAVLKRGLSKDAADRYPSCAAYVDALEESLALSAAPLQALPRPLMVEAEPVPLAATKTLSLPDSQPAELNVQSRTPPAEPPAPALAVYPSFKTLDRTARRFQLLRQGGWRTWMGVAAPIVLIAAVASYFHQESMPPAPSIKNFSSNRKSILRGESVRLTWSVANATDVRIGPEVGEVALEGERSIAPSQTTSFTLVARGPGGEVSQSAEVEVKAPTRGGIDAVQPPPKPVAKATKVEEKTTANKSGSAVYTGPKEGRIVWTRDLDAGEEIDLGAKAGSLPGVPVSIEIHPPSVHVVIPPGPGNQWRRLVVRNDGKKQVAVVVNWAVIPP